VKKLFLLLITAVSVNIAANAQTVINLDAARLLAVTNSQSLAQADVSIQRALLSERSHFYSLFPSITSRYSISADYLGTDRAGDPQFLNPLDTFKAGISLSMGYSLQLGGGDFIQRTINQISTERTRISALKEYFSVLDTVDRAYYTILKSIADLQSAESSLEAANRTLTVAQVRFNNGMMNQIDYLSAQADRESSENSRNQLQRALSLNMINLKDLIGVQGDLVLEPVDFDKYDEVLRRLAAISNEDADLLFMELWNIMTANNPDLRSAALSNQSAELTYTNSVRSRYAPSLSVSLGFGDILSYSSTDGFSGPSRYSGSISIGGTIPIEVWKETNWLESQRITRDNTLDSYSTTLRTSQNSLLSALYGILNQANTVLSSRRSLEIEENRYAGTMERYMLSQSSISDLGNASRSLANSRNSLNTANYNFLQSLSTLRSYCALDDEQRLIQVLLGN